MNKDQVKGRIAEAKGKLKEVAGKTRASFGDAKERCKK
ncbi:putative csbD-like protein [Burkholderia ubonensis MSMB22]|nr:putative csbD-like protein [Burkholderia ubonensis MSMB22]